MKISNQQLLPGTVLGNRYTILSNLGQGGMAYVYLAEDQQTEERVALKVMRDELSGDPEFIRRFATEARAAASLDHPNIVRVLDYGQDGDIRYIVQELIEGMTLKDLIQQQGRLDWQLAGRLMIQIALALEHAHRREVIHRDMKPQNILITEDMVAKVTDFGIARASHTNTITLTGGVAFGSVHYFSPEQARGGLVTERSDLYSLGIMLYEMLTGELPFDGDTSVAVAIKHLQEMPPAPSSIAADLPPALDAIVFKAIQKSPERRYQTARQFADELDAFMIEPHGVYGLISQSSPEWDATTTALGLQRQESNYDKIRDIERTISTRRRSRYRDTALVITIVAVALILISVVAFWVVQRVFQQSGNLTPQEVTLSDYRGRPFDEVESELRRLDITVERKVQPDPNILVGVIIAQDPEPNTVVRVGGPGVTLVVSGGRETVTIPQLTGQTAAQASATLTNNYGLVVVEESGFSAEVAAGHVIGTIPAAGEAIGRGDQIKLLISRGSQTVRMPNLVGMSWSVAVDELRRLNLVMGSATAINKQRIAEKDRVILSQGVAPNTEVAAQSSISVVYGTQTDKHNMDNPSPTPAPVQKMPRLLGLSIPDAATMLEGMGVSLDRVQKVPIRGGIKLPDREQIVIIQSIPPNQSFNIGSRILLTYGSAQDWYEYFVTPTPSPTPSPTPTPEPTATPTPTPEPTATPTPTPKPATPTPKPTAAPTPTPTPKPATPTPEPTAPPTPKPTKAPTAAPTPTEPPAP